MKIFLSLVVVLIAAPAVAQTPDGVRLSIYQSGATSPTTSFDMLNAAIQCNQAPPAANASTVNPTRVSWNDTANAGRVCQWTDPGTGPLMALPLGASYEGGLRFFNAAGSGPESTRAPFTRLGPPTVAPAGLLLTRPGS